MTATLELNPTLVLGHRVEIAGVFKVGGRSTSITILPTTILHVRSRGRGILANPFDPEFPSRWTWAYLPPDCEIRHLSYQEWYEIANQVNYEHASTFAGVLCGAPIEKVVDNKFNHPHLAATDSGANLSWQAHDWPVGLDPLGSVAFALRRV